MERPSIWVIIVVLLLAVLFLREPRFQRSEEIFLRWLIRHSQPAAKTVPITIVEIGENPPPPLEAALLLQGILEFKPTVIAIEPILQWGERSKDQEQIFFDQAMRVPNLLLGAELTATPDPDELVAEISGFMRVETSAILTGRAQMPVYRHSERLLEPRHTATYHQADGRIVLPHRAVIEIDLRVGADTPSEVRAHEPVVESRAGRSHGS